MVLLLCLFAGSKQRECVIDERSTSDVGHYDSVSCHPCTSCSYCHRYTDVILTGVLGSSQYYFAFVLVSQVRDTVASGALIEYRDLSLLWPPCVADADMIFLRCGFFYLLFFLA